MKYRLDAAVRAITNPTRDAPRERFTLQVHAKADALHVSSYAQAASDDHRSTLSVER
jgi:hypothetical protein